MAESIGLWRASPRVFCLASASLVARRGSRQRQKRGQVEKSVYNGVANPDFSTPFALLTTVEMTPFLQSNVRSKYALEDMCMLLYNTSILWKNHVL
jgi:hypothetical protein